MSKQGDDVPDQGIYTSDLGKQAVARLKRLAPVLAEAQAVALAYANKDRDGVWSAAKALCLALDEADQEDPGC